MGAQVTTLLCDSDIFAFKLASTNQVNSPWGSWTYPEQAIQSLDSYVAELTELLKADAVIMCLTDPEDNFRYDIMDNYKDRDRSGRPELLTMLKQHLTDEYKSYIRPRLEADDIMGILATHPKLVDDSNVIVVSEDKDLRTVPCKLYNPNRPELKTITITDQQAKAFHMWQTICGDATDGFKGAKGVGKASEYAQDIIAADPEDMWDIVLDAFASAGMTEADALVNARMAKILTWRHYNFKLKEVIHWTPLDLHIDAGY